MLVWLFSLYTVLIWSSGRSYEELPSPDQGALKWTAHRAWRVKPEHPLLAKKKLDVRVLIFFFLKIRKPLCLADIENID